MQNGLIENMELPRQTVFSKLKINNEPGKRNLFSQAYFNIYQNTDGMLQLPSVTVQPEGIIEESSGARGELSIIGTFTDQSLYLAFGFCLCKRERMEKIMSEYESIL